ncbi:hypothetical protein [Ferrovibrio terrae]|uniref:hypothetical protein n=1 Tax=Ferrovibrio terrae TaxID=2594003 RepID=UPI003137FF4C
MPATQTAKTPSLEPAAMLAANLSDVQERSAATFARAYDVLAKTSQAIWESEPELFKLESEQLLKSLAPPKAGDNPAAGLSAYFAELHDGSERMIARMRHINDLAWGCGWQIATIYADGLQDMWKHAQAKIPTQPAAEAARGKTA